MNKSENYEEIDVFRKAWIIKKHYGRHCKLPEITTSFEAIEFYSESF